MAHAGSHATARSKDLDKVAFLIGDTVVEVGIDTSRKKVATARSARMAPDDRITLNATAWPHIPGVPFAWSEPDAEPFEAWILGISRDLLVMGSWFTGLQSGSSMSGAWSAGKSSKSEHRGTRANGTGGEGAAPPPGGGTTGMAAQAGSEPAARRRDTCACACHRRAVPSPIRGGAGRHLQPWRAWALVQADLLDPCRVPLTVLDGPCRACWTG